MVTFWVLLKSITFKQNLLYLGHLLETFRLFFIPSSGHTELVHKINLIRLDSKTILTGDFNLIILAVFNWACLIRCRMDMTCRKCNRTEKMIFKLQIVLSLQLLTVLSLCLFHSLSLYFLSITNCVPISPSLSLSFCLCISISVFFYLFLTGMCFMSVVIFFSLSLSLFISFS